MDAKKSNGKKVNGSGNANDHALAKKANGNGGAGMAGVNAWRV
jgi:hypothetical protein